MPLIEPIAPDSAHEDAFAAFVGILRSDPMVRARNIRWSYWSNDPDDVGARSPTEADCPFVRLFPLGGGRTERRGSDGLTTDYLVPMRVIIQTMVGTTHRAEAFGLGTILLGALFPRERAAREAIDDRWRSVGVQDVFLSRPILPASPNDFYSNVIMSEGEVELLQTLQL
jgi:hypothetical protein